MSVSSSGIPYMPGRGRGGRHPSRTPVVRASVETPAISGFSARAGALFGAVMIHAICGVVALTGLGLLYAGVCALIAGDQTVASAVLVSGLGAVFAAVGIGFFYITYVSGPASSARDAAIMARNPNAPWMLRADWAARKVVDRSSLGVMVFLWIWSIGWWGISAFLWTVNHDKILAAIHDSWGDTVLVALLPLSGCIGLLAAVSVTRTWWRFGNSTLLIDTLPGLIGDSFRGRVKARLAQMPTQLIEVEIACDRRTWRRVRESDGTFKKEYRTVTVWSETTTVEPGRLMRCKEGVMIPIDVPLPAGLPACALDDEGAGILWFLHVRSQQPDGSCFTAHFEVPVYARP